MLKSKGKSNDRLAFVVSHPSQNQGRMGHPLVWLGEERQESRMGHAPGLKLSIFRSRAMVHKRFEDFLDNTEMYKACEQYWERLVRDVEESLNQTGEWERWLLRQYPNGTPVEMDGNPIYDGRSRQINRAFKILQHRPVSDDLEIAAWLERNGEEYPEIPGEELVLNLSLSEETGHIARRLLSMWMTPNITAEEMQQFIREHLESES
jgi:hypothetical protein